MYVRFVLDRKKAEMRLNIELSLDDLIKWDEKTMRFTDREMSENALLNTIDKNFEGSELRPIVIIFPMNSCKSDLY